MSVKPQNASIVYILEIKNNPIQCEKQNPIIWFVLCVFIMCVKLFINVICIDVFL